ncbi:Na/Pi cotransporter family protein [Alicycliphilus denitrificans]|uniref:Na/Pi cotransporter family protein n=2 Tax=Pseudomonadota TaxID=1224 RepID=A0A3R7EG13_9BURK|nr:Na/Pi cotransporter family protein [Alicycliphilus denitrificans]RKJ98849.1 Na/Pi cotransporter family protein [Alicycliphilus denitrificans]
MKHLLNLLAAIALLVWGTHLVRVGVLRVFGANLRSLLARSMGNRFTAALSGIGVTALVQSSTATSLMTASFVGQGLIALPAALAVMRGADIGTALMAVLFSTDLSWLSPLFIFVGVVLYLSRQETTSGRVGRVLIGLGLMLLALERVTQATEPMMASPITHVVLESMGSDVFAEILIGAVLAIVSYSSLAVVLLIAAMADTSVVPLDMALGMVLGANLGNGLTAMLTMAKSSVEVRQVTVGNMVFKLMGVVLMAPFIDGWIRFVQPHLPATSHSVVLFHLAYNIIISVGFIGLTQWVAHVMTRLLPPLDPAKNPLRPHHLDPSALATPSLAISCAAREALHQADLVETMLNGLKTVWQTDDQRLAAELRAMDDQVDSLYSAIKYYMTKISRSSLDESEGRRWTEIISFTINMEQIGDLVERVLQDVEDKKIKKGRKFSHAGLQEINEMHDHLVANLRLAMSVFLTSNARDAQKLLEEKTRFRELELAYSATHLNRLADNTIQSIETSSLHIDIISDLKRINSLLCSVAYPVLEANASIRPLQPQGEAAAAPQGERQ